MCTGRFVSERVDLVGQLRLAMLQQLELHFVSLSFGETELFLLTFLALCFGRNHGQIVEKAVIVVDKRHGNLRFRLVRLEINIVPRKHLVVRVDNVQDLDKPGGVCTLLAIQELEQVVQLGYILAALAESGRGGVNLVDDHLFGRRRQANWRHLDMFCTGTEVIASSNFLHEVERDNALLACW